MTRNVKKTIQGGAFALTLCFAGASLAEDTRNDGPHFNAEFGTGAAKAIIPIDCNLLGPEGQKTLDFVKQFGIWGHITHETDIGRAEQHLRLHGITPERIENVRQHCIEHYL